MNLNVNDILKNFFVAFFHPFKVQKSFYENRMNRSDVHNKLLTLVSDQSDLAPGFQGLQFTEVLSITWLMACIKAIYGMMALLLGLTGAQYLSSSGQIAIMGNELSRYHWTIFFLILNVVLFPFVIWIYTRFWIAIVTFFGNIFNKTYQLEAAATETVHHALVSYTFYLIPIFGPLIQTISFVIYLYAGLKNNIQLSAFQSIIVILTPLFLLFVLCIFLFISLMMMLMALFPTLFT